MMMKIVCTKDSLLIETENAVHDFEVIVALMENFEATQASEYSQTARNGDIPVSVEQWQRHFHTWFDRTLCDCDGEGMMHTRCSGCGEALDGCAHEQGDGPNCSPEAVQSVGRNGSVDVGGTGARE